MIISHPVIMYAPAYRNTLIYGELPIRMAKRKTATPAAKVYTSFFESLPGSSPDFSAEVDVVSTTFTSGSNFLIIELVLSIIAAIFSCPDTSILRVLVIKFRVALSTPSNLFTRSSIFLAQLAQSSP